MSERTLETIDPNIVIIRVPRHVLRTAVGAIFGLFTWPALALIRQFLTFLEHNFDFFARWCPWLLHYDLMDPTQYFFDRVLLNPFEETVKSQYEVWAAVLMYTAIGAVIGRLWVPAWTRRFRLRTLFFVVTVVAIGLGAIMAVWNHRN